VFGLGPDSDESGKKCFGVALFVSLVGMAFLTMQKAMGKSGGRVVSDFSKTSAVSNLDSLKGCQTRTSDFPTPISLRP
jgi:hypothetical protein